MTKWTNEEYRNVNSHDKLGQLANNLDFQGNEQIVFNYLIVRLEKTCCHCSGIVLSFLQKNTSCVATPSLYGWVR